MYPIIGMLVLAALISNMAVSRRPKSGLIFLGFGWMKKENGINIFPIFLIGLWIMYFFFFMRGNMLYNYQILDYMVLLFGIMIINALVNFKSLKSPPNGSKFNKDLALGFYVNNCMLMNRRFDQSWIVYNKKKDFILNKFLHDLSLVMNEQVDTHQIENSDLSHKWKLACTRNNLTAVNDTFSNEKMPPPILRTGKNSFIVDPIGFNKSDFTSKIPQLSASMGTSICKIEQNDKGHIIINYTNEKLPTLIDYSDIPIKKGKICLGKSLAGFEYISPKEMVHMQIAGTTGSGKSVGIKMLTMQLLQNFNDCIVILISPKSKRDYEYFGKAKNVVLIPTAIQLAEGIKLIESERERREDTLTNEYHLFVIIDEADNIINKESYETVERLVTMGRSAKIHCFVCSQSSTTSDSNLSSKAVKNLPSGLCFKVDNDYDSKRVIGNSRAKHIDEAHTGRAIINTKKGNTDVQVPFLSDDMAIDLVSFLPTPKNTELAYAVKNAISHV